MSSAPLLSPRPAPYIVRYTSEAFSYCGGERVFDEREAAIRYAEGLRPSWDVRVTQGGEPVPLAGDECEDCGYTWGVCDGCDVTGWLRSTNGGETAHCGACGCPTCDGGPRQLAHDHCPKHGGCRG